MNKSVEMNTIHKTKSKKAKRRVTVITILALLIPTISGGLLYATSNSGSDKTALPSTPTTDKELRVLTVDTVSAKVEEEYPVQERFVGRAEAARTSNLGFELAGTVTSIAKDEGQRVKEGEILATLDTARLDARREELVALLNQSEATLTLAKSTLERFSSAVVTNAVSKQQVDEANESKLKAAAAVTRVNSQIKAIDVDLKKSVLIAPFAGAVATRSVDEGTIVSPGISVLRLVEVDHLEVRVGFSLRAANGLTVGDKLDVVPALAGSSSVKATVERILPERGQRTRTVDVILTIDSPSKSGLRPGDLVEIPVNRTVNERGIWLPRTALTESSRG